jgi:hypothetical protein
MSGFVIRTNHVPFDWVICKTQEIRITATERIRIIEDSVKSTKFNNNQDTRHRAESAVTRLSSFGNEGKTEPFSFSIIVVYSTK